MKKAKWLYFLTAMALTAALLAACATGTGEGAAPSERPSAQPSPPPVERVLPLHTKTVQKQRGQDFKILQLSDMQLDSKTNVNVETTVRNALPLVKQLVADTQPDLIVLIGDNVAGPDDHALYGELVKLMDSFEIPWAPIFGNHERDIKTMAWQEQQFLNAQNCLYQRGEDFNTNEQGYEYRGNYGVAIEEGRDILYSMIFLDSGPLYGNFCEGQMAWYRDYVEEISAAQYGAYDTAAGSVVPSMLFYHIPIQEFTDAAEAYIGPGGIGRVPAGAGIGENKEAQGAQGRDLNLFGIAKEMQSTTHMFCGHRHTNNSVLTYRGITLAFGTKTGKNNSHSADMLGGTLITVEDATNEVTVSQLLYRETQGSVWVADHKNR